MKLGEAMVKEGLITNEVLARALERQIIFGGRLGTNLVEMGAISEEALAKFLSRSLGVPYAGPESFENVQQEIIASLPVELAQKYTAFPIKRERSRLHLAMKDPNDFAALDELRFITGLDVKPYIASELRIVYALEKYYGIKRDLRYVSLLEDEKRAAPGPAPAHMPPAIAAPQPPRQKKPEQDEYLGDESQDQFFVTSQPINFVPEEPEAAPKQEPETAPAPAAAAVPQTSQQAKPAPQAPKGEQAAAPAEGEPRENPYEALASPVDRDHVAKSIVAAARQDLKRAALFLVKGSQVSGWKADGEGLDLERALSAVIELSGPMVFREVVEEKSYYRGPVLRVPQNAALLEALGGDAPHEAIAYPLIIKGKVVGVLYGDNGKDSMIACDIQKLSTLMAKASMSLEILILKNKILN